MGASNKFFLDKRETEQHEQFDHKANFCDKIKRNYMTTDEFRDVQQGNLYEITKIFIRCNENGYIIDNEYKEILFKILDKLEPVYLKSAEYYYMVKRTGVDNMKRVHDKYDNINHFMKSTWKFDLMTSILECDRVNNR